MMRHETPGRMSVAVALFSIALAGLQPPAPVGRRICSWEISEAATSTNIRRVERGRRCLGFAPRLHDGL